MEARVLGALGSREVGAPVANVCPRGEPEQQMDDIGLTIGQLWTDYELCERIYAQAAHLSAGELLGDLKPKFYERVSQFAALESTGPCHRSCSPKTS